MIYRQIPSKTSADLFVEAFYGREWSQPIQITSVRSLLKEVGNIPADKNAEKAVALKLTRYALPNR